MTPLLVLLLACFFPGSSRVFDALSKGTSPETTQYNYFAIGSNMLPSTMESLRGISWERASAGVLCDYRLAFDVPGNALVEPSAASIRYSPGGEVHGVLYDLTPDQFATVGRTEGVPFGYLWEQCHVVPYVGNGDSAGAQAVQNNDAAAPVVAFALTTRTGSRAAVTRATGRHRTVSTARKRDDIPPSPSYLRILQRGATHWELDRSYQRALSEVETARNLLFPDGLSGYLLQAAELFNPPRSSNRK